MVIAGPCITGLAGGGIVEVVAIKVMMTAGLFDEEVVAFTVMERVILSDAGTAALYITAIAVIVAIIGGVTGAIADITSITIQRLSSQGNT